MSAAARTYWMAVAHDHHGDRTEAARAYEKARAHSRGRPRDLIDQALAALAGTAAPRRIELAAVASEVVARIEAAPLPPPIRAPGARRPHATWLLTALLVAISATTALAIGPTSDIGVLMRAGAMVRGVVDHGEWWRLVACLFIHVGALHLVLNAAGLFFFGRLAEDLFGTARMIAIFGVAGIAGALASYLASPAGISMGASGAVFGLLGAVFIEITWHRSRYRAAWKRGLWGALAVVTVGQLGYGFLSPVIDQWAHGAGLLAGGLLGLVLSPSARWTRAGVFLARAIALGFGALVMTAAVLVARTSLADSLTAGGPTRHAIDGFAITVPASWEVSANQVFQPNGVVVVRLAQQPNDHPREQIAMWMAEEGRRWKNELGELGTSVELTKAQQALIALPAGWEGVELEAAPEDAMGHRQRMRLIVCGRAFGDAMVLMAISIPETVASAAPEFLAALIASTGPA